MVYHVGWLFVRLHLGRILGQRRVGLIRPIGVRRVAGVVIVVGLRFRVSDRREHHGGYGGCVSGSTGRGRFAAVISTYASRVEVTYEEGLGGH